MDKNNKNSNYYVYVCYVDDVVKYVGKGQGNRYKHCNSGTSSCLELNKDFFSGKKIDVFKVIDNITENEALIKESFIIDEFGLDNLYNKKSGLYTSNNDLLKRSQCCVYDAISIFFENKEILEQKFVFNFFCKKIYKI